MSWRPVDDSWAFRWDDFVSGQPEGRASHLTGFGRAVRDIYRFEPFYRAYVTGGTLGAVFPGFFHNSLLYGRKIVSQPFFEYGGPLFAAEMSPAERAAAVEEFAWMTERALRIKNSAHLEMRNPPSGPFADPPFHRLALFTAAVRRLDDPESMWRALSSKDRNIIQKAREYGLAFSALDGEDGLRRAFYPLYLRTMKRLGTPPHPLAYLLALARHLAGRMKVFLASFRRLPVAALVAWVVGRTAHVTDMCSDDAAFFLRPNDFAVWEFLCWARANGCDVFDFGPVRYRGQEVFKKKWNMDLVPYSYVYLSRHPGPVKNPYGGAGGLLAAAPAIWRAAVPSGIARRVGKFLRREVGL